MAYPVQTEGDTYTCKKCKVTKPLVEFYFDKARAGIYPYCKVCQRESSKAVYHATKSYERSREAGLRVRYGLTLADYDALLEAQDGKCPCGRPPSESAHGVLAVDHDHFTGRVRGLLCSRCNLVLGLMRNDADALFALAAYAEGSVVREGAAVVPFRIARVMG